MDFIEPDELQKGIDLLSLGIEDYVRLTASCESVELVQTREGLLNAIKILVIK